MISCFVSSRNNVPICNNNNLLQIVTQHCSAYLSQRQFQSYGHCSDLGVEIALSHRHVEKRWFSLVKWLQQSTAHTFTMRAPPRLIPFSDPMDHLWTTLAMFTAATASVFPVTVSVFPMHSHVGCSKHLVVSDASIKGGSHDSQRPNDATMH